MLGTQEEELKTRAHTCNPGGMMETRETLPLPEEKRESAPQSFSLTLLFGTAAPIGWH